MEPPTKSESRIEPRRRRRIRRFVAIVVLPAALFACWKAWPIVEDRIRLHLAERAIDDGRLEEAERRLDLLILEHPMRPRPKLLKAKLARVQGEITEAEETLQRAIELGLPVSQARREHELLRR